MVANKLKGSKKKIKKIKNEWGHNKKEKKKKKKKKENQ